MNMFNHVARHGGDLNSSLARSTFVARSTEAGLASLDASTAYSATASGIINIFNSSTTNHVIIPVALRLVAKAVNTTASDGYISIDIDQGGTRYTSGGTLLTGVTTSVGSPGGTALTDRVSVATIHQGVLVTTAATAAAKQVMERLASKVILVIDDAWVITFGDYSDHQTSDVNDLYRISAPPVWIGPQGNMIVHWFGTAQAADPKMYAELTYVEVGHGHNT